MASQNTQIPTRKQLHFLKTVSSLTKLHPGEWSSGERALGMDRRLKQALFHQRVQQFDFLLGGSRKLS